MGRLDDPLNDPLPRRRPPSTEPGGPVEPDARAEPADRAGPVDRRSPAPRRPAPDAGGSPWFRPHTPGGPPQDPAPRPTAAPAPAPARAVPAVPTAPDTPTASATPTVPAPGEEPDPETVALRRARPPARRDGGEAVGGRAARRRAAARAARARKENAAVIASRGVGELFITCGVLLLLFVAYQLWWTNVQAGFERQQATSRLEEKWDAREAAERRPDAFEPGEGFALMYLPTLDVAVPVAEGIDKDGVLDKGLVGHYDEASGLETAMPWDEEGNFAVAGHRNTHGEPFRYINRLRAGDPIVVETADTYYVYEMTSVLPQTTPSDVEVIAPVPPKSGFTEPGRYVTLTTCTPEFTSKYRLIVWGKMVEERPRGDGKPDALVG
ncbi:class E sortase [Streptomyces chumphonensis]|uniref:Class E sortase n=1 Tax=Streptomyces chumphonensis TaxID=1214925 RepID=A0A927F537_9ACTN|nr:class E sortase [Streptomyces chumphonensis]